jgi:hypothetical protein
MKKIETDRMELAQVPIVNPPQRLRIFLLSLSFIFLMISSSCSYLVLKNGMNCSGMYEYVHDTGYGKFGSYLELRKDGTFTLSPMESTVYPALCEMPECVSEGSWKQKGGKIVLNSFLRSKKENAFIFEIEQPRLYRDSLKIELLNLSDGKPIEGQNLYLLGKENSYFIDPVITNNLGIAIFSKELVESIESPIGLCKEGMNRIPLPKSGYYYRIYYQDCWPVVFNNEKLKIDADTLILKKSIITDYNERGREISTNFYSKFVKVN